MDNKHYIVNKTKFGVSVCEKTTKEWRTLRSGKD